MRSYRAFISYSHRDETTAQRLHKRLEGYKPPHLSGQALKRLSPVFRDRDELSTSSDLGGRINEALSSSENLIVLCSPQSAASQWVNEEIRAFAERHGAENIHPVIVDGSPPSCFPPALLEATPEPLAADLTAGKDGFEDGALKLIAGLLGAPFGLLKDREAARVRRRTQITLGVAAVFACLMIFAGLAAWEAVKARGIAEAETARAEAATERAQAELSRAESAISAAVLGIEGVVSELADDTAAGRIHIDAAAELLTTTEGVAEKVVAIAPNDPALQLSYGRLLAVLGDTYATAGQIARAETAAQRAVEMFDAFEAEGAELGAPAQRVRIRAMLTLSAAAEGAGDMALADRRLLSANEQAEALPAPDLVAEITGRRAILARAVGDIERARELFSLELEQLSENADPRKPETYLAQGLALLRRGEASANMGMPQTAAANYIFANDLLERALERKGDDARYRAAYSRGLRGLANVRRKAGELEKAQELITESVAFNARLAADDPRNTDKAMTLMVSLTEAKDIHNALGRRQEAYYAAKKAEEIAAELITLDPENHDFARLRIERSLDVAEAEIARGSRAVALPIYIAASEQLVPLLKAAQDNADLIALQANIEMRRGRAAFEVGKTQDALESFSRAEETYAALLGRETQNIGYLAGRVEALREKSHTLGFVGEEFGVWDALNQAEKVLEDHGKYSVRNFEHLILRGRLWRTTAQLWVWDAKASVGHVPLTNALKALRFAQDEYGATAALDRELAEVLVDLALLHMQLLRRPAENAEEYNLALGYVNEGRALVSNLLKGAPNDVGLRLLAGRFDFATGHFARYQEDSEAAAIQYRKALVKFQKLEGLDADFRAATLWSGVTSAFLAIVSVGDAKRAHLERAYDAFARIEAVGGLSPYGWQGYNYVRKQLAANK